MRVVLTRRAAKDLDGLPLRLQDTVRKQLELLVNNLRHPSLHAKKYGGTDDIWQGRVNRDYRFYFRIPDPNDYPASEMRAAFNRASARFGSNSDLYAIEKNGAQGRIAAFRL